MGHNFPYMSTWKGSHYLQPFSLLVRAQLFLSNSYFLSISFDRFLANFTKLEHNKTRKWERRKRNKERVKDISSAVYCRFSKRARKERLHLKRKNCLNGSSIWIISFSKYQLKCGFPYTLIGPFRKKFQQNSSRASHFRSRSAKVLDQVVVS